MGWSGFRVMLINGKIECIPTTSAIYKGIFIVKINRIYNPYNVAIVRKYFEENSHHYLLNILEGN